MNDAAKTADEAAMDKLAEAAQNSESLESFDAQKTEDEALGVDDTDYDAKQRDEFADLANELSGLTPDEPEEPEEEQVAPEPQEEPEASAVNEPGADAEEAESPSEEEQDPADVVVAEALAKLQEAEAPQEAPQAIAEPQVAPQVAPQVTLEQVAQQALQELETGYKLSDEDKKALYETPDEILPKMFAKVQMQTLNAAMQFMQSYVPQTVSMVAQRESAVQANQRAFYTKWPLLDRARNDPEKGARVRATLNRVKDGYFRANPNADVETAIREIGTMASVTLGMPLELPPKDSIKSSAQEVQVPTVPTGGPAPMGRPKRTTQGVNEFELLSEAIERDA